MQHPKDRELLCQHDLWKRYFKMIDNTLTNWPCNDNQNPARYKPRSLIKMLHFSNELHNQREILQVTSKVWNFLSGAGHVTKNQVTK